MGTQIRESEPCICSCSWGSRTWIWYRMSHKPGKRAARRVRGPYLDYSTSTTHLLAAGGAGDRTSKASRKGTVEPPIPSPEYIYEIFGEVHEQCQRIRNIVSSTIVPIEPSLLATCALRKSPVVDTLPQIPVRSLTTQPLRTLPEQNRTTTQYYAHLSLSPGPRIVCLTGHFRMSVLYRISVHVTGNPWLAIP